MKKRLILITVSLALAITVVGWFVLQKKSTRFHNIELDNRPHALNKGRQLAEKHCLSCHSMVEPDLLTRENWNYMLAYMGLFLGINDQRHVAHDAAYLKDFQMRQELISFLKLGKEKAELSNEDWQSLRNYYLFMAPEEFSFAVPDLKPFSFVKLVGFTEARGATTLIKYDKGEVFAGLAGSNRLISFNTAGQRLRIYQLNSAPVSVHRTTEGFYVTTIGDLFGRMSEQYPSKLYYYRFGNPEPRLVLDKMKRTAHTMMVDLDNDGQEDLVQSAFGGFGGGGLYVYYRRGQGFRKTEVTSGDSVVMTRAHDFDNDGRLDLAVLFSNVRESLQVFYNRKNRFISEKIADFKASYGAVSLTVADLNDDGDVEIIVANGDTSDSGPYNFIKPYHGIRIYSRETKTSSYREIKFLPLPGATIVKAGDVDGDGDLDLVATAHFADYRQKPPAGLVIFLNDNLDFSYNRIENTDSLRFSVVEVADTNGDKQAEIFFGTANYGMKMIEDGKAETVNFDTQKPALYLVRNK